MMESREHPGLIVRTVGGRLVVLPAMEFRPTARPEIERFREAARLMAEFLARERETHSLGIEEMRAIFGACIHVERHACRVQLEC